MFLLSLACRQYFPLRSGRDLVPPFTAALERERGAVLLLTVVDERVDCGRDSRVGATDGDRLAGETSRCGIGALRWISGRMVRGAGEGLCT